VRAFSGLALVAHDGRTDADQKVTSSKSTARVKARMLSGALEDNLDVIHGRVPRPLRRAGRHVPLWIRRVAVAVAATSVLASAGAARWPAAAPSPPASTTPFVTPSPRSVPHAVLDMSVVSQPISPHVLDLTVRRVVIDAGHGGDNPGTSSATGVREKDVTLDIAARVQRLLAARGFDTVMTRAGDETLSLQQRAAKANGHRGDVFVSIHLNWLQRPDGGGIETYYLGPSRGADLDAIAALENQQPGYSLSDMRALLERIYTDARRDESRRLATLVQQSLVDTLPGSEPAAWDRGVKMAPFVVLSATEMPAILAEVSCLSNEEQAERLKTADERQKIAEALVSGIQAFARKSRATASERTGSDGR
jgi:N-acetylmuramoyl-L-alanine amidase